MTRQRTEPDIMGLSILRNMLGGFRKASNENKLKEKRTKLSLEVRLKLHRDKRRRVQEVGLDTSEPDIANDDVDDEDEPEKMEGFSNRLNANSVDKKGQTGLQAEEARSACATAVEETESQTFNQDQMLYDMTDQKIVNDRRPLLQLVILVETMKTWVFRDLSASPPNTILNPSVTINDGCKIAMRKESIHCAVDPMMPPSSRLHEFGEMDAETQRRIFDATHRKLDDGSRPMLHRALSANTMDSMLASKPEMVYLLFRDGRVPEELLNELGGAE